MAAWRMYLAASMKSSRDPESQSEENPLPPAPAPPPTNAAAAENGSRDDEESTFFYLQWLGAGGWGRGLYSYYSRKRLEERKKEEKKIQFNNLLYLGKETGRSISAMTSRDTFCIRRFISK
jgi:hypothetical protein